MCDSRCQLIAPSAPKFPSISRPWHGGRYFSEFKLHCKHAVEDSVSPLPHQPTPSWWLQPQPADARAAFEVFHLRNGSSRGDTVDGVIHAAIVSEHRVLRRDEVRGSDGTAAQS